jgi:hypothetical protein
VALAREFPRLKNSEFQMLNSERQKWDQRSSLRPW